MIDTSMFTLRFPFELPPRQAISDPEARTTIGSLDVSLGRKDGFYVLTIAGFRGENIASEYLDVVWTGLAWLLLNRGLASKAERSLQRPAYAKDPIECARRIREQWGLDVGTEVHGLMDGNWPAVFPSCGNFRTVTAGSITAIKSWPGNSVLEVLQEGMQFPNAHRVQQDEKLQTALELYSASFTEHSERARFLTLMMVLETLAERRKRPESVQTLLKGFLLELDKHASTLDPNSDELSAIHALKRELDFRAADSIRSQIRILVRTTLAEASDCSEVEAKTVKLYDQRSMLVHEGSLPDRELSAASSNARLIVQRVLKTRFLQTANVLNQE